MSIVTPLYKFLSTAFVTGCIFFCSCDDAKKKDNINAKKTGVEEATNVVINYSIAGNRKAVLHGPLMYRVQDTVTYIEFPKTIHVDFYDTKADTIESILDARYAKYKDNQNIVFLKDSVRVINIKGDTLYCDELYWDRTKTNKEFYTEKPVRIRTRTHIINGIGMDARQDFKNWHIVQSTGIVKVANSQFPD